MDKNTIWAKLTVCLLLALLVVAVVSATNNVREKSRLEERVERLEKARAAQDQFNVIVKDALIAK